MNVYHEAGDNPRFAARYEQSTGYVILEENLTARNLLAAAIAPGSGSLNACITEGGRLTLPPFLV